MELSLNMNRNTIVSVPGKVILAGEHAVVYGYAAVVGAIDKRLRARLRWGGEGIRVIDKTKDLRLVNEAIKQSLKMMDKKPKGFELEIKSEIPIGCGLGSSAALATGVVYGLLEGCLQEVKNRVIKQIEDYQHGKSSGVDQTVVREGGVLRYVKGGKKKQVEVKSLPKFLLVDSGRPSESTGEMVAMVNGEYKKKKQEFERIFKRMGKIAEDWGVEKIKENQRLLEEIGVVGEKAKKMVRLIEEGGGLAKVCGAGGVKLGSGMLLVYHDNMEKLEKLIEENSWRYFQVKLGVEGVRYE